MNTTPPEATFSFTGGWLCLDFVNTVSWRPSSGAPEQEQLIGYEVLLAWSRQGGVLADAVARRLLERAAQAPDEAARTLRRAIMLREAIYRLCSAAAAGRQPDRDDLDLLNAALAEALAHRRVLAQGAEYRWGWAEEERALDQMLWPVVTSAAELLTSNARTRVRECAGNKCSWLFLDMSRNQSRQWCDMQECGNRAKARRHYQKHKAGAPAH